MENGERSSRLVSSGSSRGSVFSDDPPGVDDTRDPGKAAEEDVDQELTTAACLEEDWYGRQQDS